MKNQFPQTSEQNTGVRPGSAIVAKNMANGFGNLAKNQVTDRYLYDTVTLSAVPVVGAQYEFFNAGRAFPLSNVGRNLEVGESIAVQAISFFAAGSVLPSVPDTLGALQNDGFVTMRVGNTRILDNVSIKSQVGWSTGLNNGAQTLILSKAIVIPPQTDFSVTLRFGGGNGSTGVDNFLIQCVLSGTGALLRLNSL